MTTRRGLGRGPSAIFPTTTTADASPREEKKKEASAGRTDLRAAARPSPAELAPSCPGPMARRRRGRKPAGGSHRDRKMKSLKTSPPRWTQIVTLTLISRQMDLDAVFSPKVSGVGACHCV